jgi:cysteine desulfuration protein SufE
MSTSMTTVSLQERIDALVAEFSELDPRERLELLLDYAKNLPSLPAEYEQQRLAGEHRIHECQSPVFLWTLLADGRVVIHAWAAPESPTVKGFVGIARELFTGLPPEAVKHVDTNLVQRLGLTDALGMMRMRGLSAVLFYLRKNIESLSGAQQDAQAGAAP